MKRPAEPLTQDEALALLDACEGRRNAVRDRAIIALLYGSGLRCAEALALRPVDIKTDECSIYVLHGKGDRSRLVGCDRSMLEYVKQWMVVRPVNAETLFCTSTGRPIISCYVRRLMAQLGRSARLAKRVHAHGLRHGLASSLMRERAPLHLIQAQLGHTSLATTARYIARIAPVELLEFMRNRK